MRFAVLGLFLLVTFAAAFFGAQFEPGAWYAGLEKPSWNPPNWLFGPVWTVLYAAMAVAAWLVWCERHRADVRLPLIVWFDQLVLNALWSYLFFGRHLMGVAFAEILVLLAAIVMTCIFFWRVRPLAGALLVPYMAWVSFAAVLNATIWRLNA